MFHKRQKIIVALLIVFFVILLNTNLVDHHQNFQKLVIDNKIDQFAIDNVKLSHRSFPVDANLFEIDSKLYKDEDYSNKISVLINFLRS